MKDQIEGNGIFDAPPYNLNTNIISKYRDEKVSGFFSVVDEKAKRWFFSSKDLSYFVPDIQKSDCNIPLLDPAPQCFDCLEYNNGETTIIKPNWWEK